MTNRDTAEDRDVGTPTSQHRDPAQAPTAELRWLRRLDLDASEWAETSALLDEVADRFDSAESEEFLAEAPVYAHRLPVRVRRLLTRFRALEEGSVLVLGAHPIDDRIGPTPSHWRLRGSPSPTLRQELLLVLYGSLLGEVFAWATQQDGRLIHDVLPIAGHELEQLGSSSEALLTWHTEDAFHPYRGDYLLLGCLRNPDDVPTTIGALDLRELARRHAEILRQPRFLIKPDESHRPHNNSTDPGSFAAVEAMFERLELVPVLFGDSDHPYLRLDPYFMIVPEADTEAAEALEAMVSLMDARMLDVALAPGEYVILDNFRVVHGRKPFRARFDGSDRWLKRINVTRDLRKAHAHGSTIGTRMLG